jgi:FAD/FMN-containing dehydrogenase
MSENGIEGFKGAVFTPDDPGYDEARTIFNAMIDKRPAYIAQCVDAEDVISALKFARGRGQPISVRSGGHSVAGNSLVEDGLVVDLRNMNAVSVDPDALTATVGGGATWSQFDRAAEPHGLATTGGRVSTTGVAGLTLGGGSGWFERKFGLACDNLISVDLVTADGRRVTASEDENAELFWALHGGGGNFGIATSFEFGLHPLPVVTLAILLFPPDRGPEVGRRYRDFVEDAPEDVGGGMLYLTGPPEEFVPERLRGQLALGVGVMYAGTEAEAREVAAPLLELSPEGQMIAEMPYAELQCALDDPPGFRNYWSAEHLHGFPDEAIDDFCARAEDMIVPSPSQQIALPWGGAVARNANDWPLTSRQARWTVHPFGLWADPADDERGKAWARGTCGDMKSYATGGVYLNFTGDEGEERIHAGFGDKYDRLAAVKAEWDPDNVFRQNHNVKPLAGAV